MRGLVPRHRRLRYRGRDEFGQPIDRTVSDFHARVVQHECDHLDGILYPQRIEDMTSFGFQDELVASGVLPLAAAAAGLRRVRAGALLPWFRSPATTAGNL